jgi:alpha-L-arabinofuranosidase
MPAPAKADSVPSLLSAAPLGLNTAPWDYIYAADTSASGGVNVIQPLLQAAGIRMLRYGGGSWADEYDWQTNTDIYKCLPDDATASFTSSCASADSLGFTQFSQQARAIGAQGFVTVNYGSGTPAEAGAWVAQAKDTPGQGVALWEVGNENYGCWEVNNELAGPPENFHGKHSRPPVCLSFG